MRALMIRYGYVTGLDLPLVNAGNDTTIFKNTQAELFEMERACLLG